MTEHTNVTTVRDLFAAFRERDAAAIARLLPEDAVWRFPGRRGKLVGDHRGRAAKTLDNPTCLRIEVRDGLPSEFREFVWDLDHVDDFRA